MTRILIVEDEQVLREQLAERLCRRCCRSGEEGHFLGLEYPVDAAVVDLGLPDIAGDAVIQAWRQAERDFPVLILTARGRWEDKVAGLEIGADDYLVKPFHNEELLARLRALLRRASGWSQSKILCDPIALDLRAKIVHVDDRETELTALEY